MIKSIKQQQGASAAAASCKETQGPHGNLFKVSAPVSTTSLMKVENLISVFFSPFYICYFFCFHSGAAQWGV